MFDNAMFLNIMNNIGITITDEIKDGKFTKLVIKKETMTINITLSFPKVIKVDTVVFLRRKFTDFFVSDSMYRKINIEFKYDDNSIDDEMLTKYFDYILRDEYCLIHVTMSCDAKIRDIYEPVFEEWIKEISIADTEG